MTKLSGLSSLETNMGKLLDMFQAAGVPVDDLRGTLPLNPNVSFHTRELQDIEGIVIHHSAGWAQATAKGIAEWCIEKRDFPGMPYTFYLRQPFPTESPPYSWAFCDRLREWGPQAYGVNSTTFGVCLGGNFLYTKPPLWMIDSLDKLVEILVQYFQEEVGTNLWVKPHREVSRTSCPGRVWEAYLEYKQ
jgi:hypothetical protein